MRPTLFPAQPAIRPHPDGLESRATATRRPAPCLPRLCLLVGGTVRELFLTAVSATGQCRVSGLSQSSVEHAPGSRGARVSTKGGGPRLCRIGQHRMPWGTSPGPHARLFVLEPLMPWSLRLARPCFMHIFLVLAHVHVHLHLLSRGTPYGGLRSRSYILSGWDTIRFSWCHIHPLQDWASKSLLYPQTNPSQRPSRNTAPDTPPTNKYIDIYSPG